MYLRPTSLSDADALLAQPGAVPLGGGTDLVVAIREELERPASLVDLTRVPGAREITWQADGSVRIGAAVRVETLARDSRVRDRLRALAEACESVGTPALRTMGTIAGNLCQRPRCWYLRSRIPCLKSGGAGCPAASGENQHHAILGGGPCYIVHPSDLAVALTALEAVVEVRGANVIPSGAVIPSEAPALRSASDEGRNRSHPDSGPRRRNEDGTTRIGISDFFVLPSERLDRETVLGAGEYVSAVEIPASSAGGVQRYEKVMQRAGWDFALVSLAAVKREDGAVRLVLGGVAPRPWRVAESVEEDVASGGLSEDDIATLAERALYDARPLAKNGYKVTLAAAVLRRAMAALEQRGGPPWSRASAAS